MFNDQPCFVDGSLKKKLLSVEFLAKKSTFVPLGLTIKKAKYDENY